VEQVIGFPGNALDLYLDAAPWLLLGVLTAGLIKGWMPQTGLKRWLGGRGLRPTVYAALIGAPLPICSCGVIPAAVALRRAGASRPATLSFMISTPETGVDSVALSYALLGPFMALARPVAAVLSAVFTGLLAGLAPPERPELARQAIPSAACSTDAGDCCDGTNTEADPPHPKWGARMADGLRFAIFDILQDIGPWLGLGILLAAAVVTLVPDEALATWGRGPTAMAVMLVLGIPMYICATASTPLAASLILAGVSPGTVMVFLLAGPATNIAAVAVVCKEMGRATMVLYLLGICLSAVTAGLVTDALVAHLSVDVKGEMVSAGELVPTWIAVGSGVALAVLVSAPPLLRTLRALAKRSGAFEDGSQAG
jgi:uncharacterized membrane protein YraQ (UPF0718 family)